MLRPVPMTRALIVGPRDDLEGTVETLYAMKLLHIVDHKEGEDGLGIGKPLEKAVEASEILVKLRSIASVLKIDEAEPVPETEVAADIRQKILSLELNISEEDAAKKKVQALLADLAISDAQNDSGGGYSSIHHFSTSAMNRATTSVPL